jgi:hypothetical protein
MDVDAANKERNKIFLCALNLLQLGPPKGILQGGIRLLWGNRDKLRLLSKFRI